MDYAYSRKVAPNIPGIVISSLLLISCFLPFVYIGIGALGLGKDVTFAKTDWGIPVVIASVAAIVFSIFQKKWGLIVPGLISLACFIIQVASTVKKYTSYFGEYGSIMDLIGELIELKAGFFAVPIFSIALIICGATIIEYHYYLDGNDNDSNNSLISKLRDEGNSSGYWICCNCGCQNALYIGTCKCGTSKSDPNNTIKQAQSKGTYASQTAKCPNCGRLVSGNQTTCFDCGARLIR